MWMFLRPDAVAVAKDKEVQKSLRRYFDVANGQKPAKFMIAKKLPAEFNENDSLEELWRMHATLTETVYGFEREIDSGSKDPERIQTPKTSFLDLKIAIANRTVQNCCLCTRRCMIDRTKGNTGYCKCGQEMTVSSIFEHLGEEPELVPSGTIFTMGCTMRCKHCQNWTISQWMENGKVYDREELAKEIDALKAKGCRNANLVGGEPTPWLAQWLETFKHVNANIPIAWNSNSYYGPETAQLLAGFVDVYLLDFKYGPDECAERISEAPNYWTVCSRNHLEAKKNGELIIRMLVLPGHIECCTKPIIEWIVKNLGTETRVNIMFQYKPEWRAGEIPELRRRLTGKERTQTGKLARKAGLANFIT